jgi:4-hydroxy-4-methyl-2-oxoglutarate aldolase
VVIGDADGVVVIPFEKIDVVIARLEKVRAAEAAMVARVADGLGVPDWVRTLHADGRVHDLDAS